MTQTIVGVFNSKNTAQKAYEYFKNFSNAKNIAFIGKETVGVLSGAIDGGIAGVLLEWGLPAEMSETLEEETKSGKTILAVTTDNINSEKIVNIFKSFKAESVLNT